MDAATTGPGSLTAHLGATPHPGHPAHPNSHHKGIHLGRERINWKPEVWERIDHAVHHEFHRTCVTVKVLPIDRVDPHVTTVPADTVLATIDGPPLVLSTALSNGYLQPGSTTQQIMPNIDEGGTVKLLELWVEFSLTPAQMEQENSFKRGEHEHHEHHEHGEHHDHHQHPEHRAGNEHHEHHHKHHNYHGCSTAVTLGTRAARILAQAFDAVVLQGQNATGNGITAGIPPGPLFASNLVYNRGYPLDFGLLCNANSSTSPYNLASSQVVPVPSLAPLTDPNAGQLITITGATGGSFILTYTPSGGSASNSPSISLTSTSPTPAQTIQTWLQGIVGTGSNAYVTTASAPGGITVFMVTINGPAAGTASPITVNTNSLTGTGTPTITIGAPARYVENTVTAIAQAYSILEFNGHYGSKAAILFPYDYADVNTPLQFTLILPADRIRELMADGIFATGSLPGIPNPISPPAPVAAGVIPNPTNAPTQAMGVVLSVGPDTVDLVIGQNPVTAFSQVDPNGYFIFRVLCRMALRPKDITAICRLEFQ